MFAGVYVSHAPSPHRTSMPDAVAVQALGQLGKAVIPRAIAALENKDFWVGIWRYTMAYSDDELCTLHLPRILKRKLGFPVVWIPPGHS